MQNLPPAARLDGTRVSAPLAWSPVLPHNNLPPVPGDQLRTPAIEARCKRATAALDTLRQTTRRLSDPETLFQTAALIEAQASSAIEEIVTTVGEMIQRMDRPRVKNAYNPSTEDALRHYDAIIDAWHRRGTEPVGTAMTIRACSTTKGRRMPVRRGHGTVIAGPRGVIYTPPTDEERIRSMLEALWRFMNDNQDDTHALVRMAAAHHQFESIHPFADGNGRTGRLINLLYLSEQELTELPVLCHSRYILRNRQDYYRLLDSTRRTDDWEPWVLWMLDGVRETAEWITDTLQRQAETGEQAIARCRDAKPGWNASDETMRFVCSRLRCRSTDLVHAELASTAPRALSTLRRIADTNILEERPGHTPALFVNPELVNLWTGD